MLAGVAPELAPPAERMRALGDGRWELKVVIDSACQRGIEQLRALLSHVDPHLTLGQLVERLVQDCLQRYDPGRPRRGRGGGRREAGAGQAPEPQAQEGPWGGAASPAKRSAQEQPGVPPALEGTSAGASTPAPAARSAEEPARGTGGTVTSAVAALAAEESARGIGGAGTSAVAARPAPPAGHEACGGSTPVSAKPAATAPTRPLRRRSRRPIVGPTPPHRRHGRRRRQTRAYPPRWQRWIVVATLLRQRSGRKRRSSMAVRGSQPEAAGPSGGSAPRPHRARRSRYIPAPVRREVWRRDGGCCSFVDPHSGRRCGSRFLLELDHIVPFALGGSAEPGNLRLRCFAHHRFRHRQTERRHTGPRERRLPGCESGGRGSVREQRE